MTETTKLPDDQDAAVLVYDDTCRICIRSAVRFARLLRAAGVVLLPHTRVLNDAALCLRHAAACEQPLSEIKLFTADGHIYGGADALIAITARRWWLWPLRALAALPGARALLRWLYRTIAARRYCLGGQCEIGRV